MKRRQAGVCAFVAAVTMVSPWLGAQEHGHGRDKGEKTTTTTTVSTEPAPDKKMPAMPVDSTTDGTVSVGGKSIAYKAVAGLLTVGSSDKQDAMLGLDGKYLPESGMDLPPKMEDQPATARMFYTAYFANGADKGTRPLTFVYNGGPGSATMYLRMTSFGPVRVQIPDVDHPVGGPYHVVPNDNRSLLDATDLVFIDAPGTGYSRVEGKDGNKSFYGIDEDGHAFDRFIRRFLTKYDRWMSPKFLFGESYGTTRDAVLAADLQQSGVDLNGVVFLSQILSFDNSADGSDGNPGTDNGFFLALPSFAATAWYHHKVPNQPAQLEPFLHEVEQYALTDYAAALMQGTDLDAAKKQAVAAKLETYTGIPAATWVKANLRITGGEYSKYLQDPADITTGRLDSRYQGPAMNPLSGDADYDPFTESVESSIVSAMNSYAHNTLKFGENMTYKPSAREPGFNWSMRHRAPGNGGWEGTSTNVSADIAYTLKVNPKMHVLLMGGYFDLGTLYFAGEYEMKHLPIPQSLAGNIMYHYFPTGHMVYVNPDAAQQLHDVTAQFIRAHENGAN